MAIWEGTLLLINHLVIPLTGVTFPLGIPTFLSTPKAASFQASVPFGASASPPAPPKFWTVMKNYPFLGFSLKVTPENYMEPKNDGF